jgi:hypothetical protein
MFVQDFATAEVLSLPPGIASTTLLKFYLPTLMRSPYRSPNSYVSSRPPGSRLVSGVVKFCLLVALILVATWFYFETTVRSKLAEKIEQRFNHFVVDSGLHVSVGQAQFVDGKGVALNNLAVKNPRR